MGYKTLEELDRKVNELKKKSNFTVYYNAKYTLKKLVFRYDATNMDLYVYIDKKWWKVGNPGSALYAFASGKDFFELMLDYKNFNSMMFDIIPAA